jgi:hypothetical protein
VAVVAYFLGERLIAGYSARSAIAMPLQPASRIELERMSLTLGDKLPIQLAPQAPVLQQTIAQIKDCIARLTDIGSPDIGLSPTLAGTAFLPVPAMARSGMMLITDHHLTQSAALKKLVELGPDAIPYLLDSLSDQTPTKLVLNDSTAPGILYLSHELSGNPLSDSEFGVLANWDNKVRQTRSDRSYTVKVGDICLVAIGQIVGRDYEAVRYQPTALVVINSPVEDTKYCQAIRTFWASSNPRQKLFDSLMFDYATQTKTGLAAYRGEALMRLLFYFPRETSGLVAKMLRELDVRKASTTDADSSPRVKNGFTVAGLVETVSWDNEPEVHAAVHDIFVKTDDISVLLAALPGIDNAERDLIRDRLKFFLNALPPTGDGANWDGKKILSAAWQRLGGDSTPLVEPYLKGGDPDRSYGVTLLVRETGDPFLVPVLLRMLSDRRAVHDLTYEIDESANSERAPMLVCDAAASSLAAVTPGVKFSFQGRQADLDKQIAVMRETLSKPVDRDDLKPEAPR